MSDNNRVVSSEVQALRNKRIGNTALELLIALHEHRLSIITTKNTNGMPDFSAEVFSLETMTRPRDVLKTTTMLRLKAAFSGLTRREYLDANPLKEIVSKRKGEGKITAKEQKMLSSEFWKLNYEVHYRLEAWSVNAAGLEELMLARKRVEQMKNNPVIRYAITARLRGDERIWGVGGIYRITKESAGNVYISGEPVPGAAAFKQGNDNAVKATYSGNQFAGNLILRENVLIMDATPEQFNELFEQTNSSLARIKVRKETIDARIAAIRAEHDQECALIGKELQDRVKEMHREKTVAEQEIQDQGIQIDMSDLDEITNFKP